MVYIDYIRHPILKIGKFLGRQAAKTCQSSELDDGYSFLSAYPFMNRRNVLNVVTNYSCIIIKSLIRFFNLIMWQLEAQFRAFNLKNGNATIAPQRSGMGVSRACRQLSIASPLARAEVIQ